MSDPSVAFQNGSEPVGADWPYKSALAIVAHPDDETLWLGGTILMHPETVWTIVTLCRNSDSERAPKFRRALKVLGASGEMGDLDDGPRQIPLADGEVEDAVLKLAGHREADVIVTHSPRGEYTRHLRHEETGRAVRALWRSGRLSSHELWTFAYSDNGRRHLPAADITADRVVILPEDVWQKKLEIITNTYGFRPRSFEAQTTPRTEAFWCYQPESVPFRSVSLAGASR